MHIKIKPMYRETLQHLWISFEVHKSVITKLKLLSTLSKSSQLIPGKDIRYASLNPFSMIFRSVYIHVLFSIIGSLKLHFILDKDYIKLLSEKKLIICALGNLLNRKIWTWIMIRTSEPPECQARDPEVGILVQVQIFFLKSDKDYIWIK